MTDHADLTGSALHPARARRASGSPVGSVTPAIAGELYVDSATNNLWVSTGTNSSNWTQITGSGGSGSVSQLVSFPTHFHPEFTPVLFTRSNIIHYAGWSLVDARHDGNAIGDLYPVFGREQDGATSDRTSYVQMRVDSGGVGLAEINLHTVIPQGFTQFGPAGITLRHRFNNWGIPAVGETADLTLEVFEPNNAGEVVAVTATRSTDGTVTDANYVELSLSQASLNAAGFVAGQLVRLRIELDKTAGADLVDCRWGRLLADFN